MTPPTTYSVPSTRRKILAGGAALGASIVFGKADAAAGDLAVAIANYTSRAPVRAGRVKLDVADLVDNGNVVPVTVTVDSPMTAADHVKAIAIFNEKNPQRDVARFTFGPRSGKASVSTRIRLASTQQLVAVAQMSDGSFWSHTVDVIITQVACVE
ncbi:MAG: SoxY-related arm protein [Polaromonas sp.]|nr:SoxY-related arm protein [Polaromonas sp.]